MRGEEAGYPGEVGNLRRGRLGEVIRATLRRGGGGGRERGSRDRALLKWQSEDQSWLRNRAAKRPKRKKFEASFSPEIYNDQRVAVII